MKKRRSFDGMSAKTGMRMVLGGLAGLFFAMDGAVYFRAQEHAAHGPAWLSYPGFLLAFGVAGACLLAVVAKLVLFPILKRDEDYYADSEEEP